MNDQQEIDRAKELASQGDTQAAVAALSQIIQRDSKNVDAWLELAKVVDEPDRVEYCLKKVLALDPGNRDALELLQRHRTEGPAAAEIQEEPIDLSARLQQEAPAPEPEKGDASSETVARPVPEGATSESGSQPEDSSTASPIGSRPERTGTAPEGRSRPEAELRGEVERTPEVEPEGEAHSTSDSPPQSEDDLRQPALQSSSEDVDRGSGSLPRSDPSGRLPSAADAVTAPLKRPTGELSEKKEPRFNRTDVILVGLTVVVGLVLCGLIGAVVVRNSLQPTESPDEIVQVVYENIGAANREDVAGYMATIHPDSPDYNSTNALIQDAFATYDLSYEIFIPEMLEQGRNRSVISFVLTTRKIRGPAFRDNMVSGEMTLRKHEGEWRIYDQTVEDVQYLN